MLSVRIAKLEDIPRLSSLMKQAVEELSTSFYSAEQTQNAAKYLTNPDPDIIGDGTYFVVEHLTEAVGCGGWSTRRKLFTGSEDQESLSADRLNPLSEAAKIRAFFVIPQYARQGIARKIYEQCESAALLAGFQSLELMATLPGVPLYRALGFKDGEEVNIELPNGSSLPCLSMFKSI